jgi:type II secretory pathway pseudopilin PulG
MKTEKEEEKKKDRRRFWALLIIIILLLFLFLIFQCQINERNDRLLAEQKQQQLLLAIEKAQRTADSIIRADSIVKADSLAEMASVEDTSSLANKTAQKTASKTLPANQSDTVSSADNLPPIASQSDTIPPTPSILPPAGRYYKPVNLRVECGEPKCETEISAGDSLNAAKGGKIENYNKTGNVYFRAIDSAGNASRWEVAAYDMASDNLCAENSYPVPVKGKTVCVDAYEFPNKHGEKPRNMVSQDAASRLCESVGKRLCSIEEWQAACKGNSNSNYPYGNNYNQTKCATDLKSAKEPNRSGFKEHCRSWHGMYDMSGNVWEWTSTPAQREGLFLVAGGAWNTQNKSSCGETSYSFYPQNEYPFVGLRCCK